MSVEAQDILTIPNAISAVGFGMVAKGTLQEGLDTPKGAGLVLTGRAFDLIDGHVARKLNQSSDFGAQVDAVLDKAGVGLILVEGVRRDIIPKPIAAAAATQNLANAFYAKATKRKYPQQSLSPSREGKLSMWWVNMSFGSFTLSALARNQADNAEAVVQNGESLSEDRLKELEEGRDFLRKTQTASKISGYVAAGVGLLYYGTRATYGYHKRYRS
ncbi:MAG: hypothetical protein RJB15_1785 [Pseudomonadota bacterium]|jgi:phosphatidylglycerophosphate synthase